MQTQKLLVDSIDDNMYFTYSPNCIDNVDGISFEDELLK